MATNAKVVNTNTIPWEYIPIPFLHSELPVKTCVQCPDTGMTIWKLRYPAGFRTVEHWHNCAHGMYILEGHIVTSEGEFGPGNFIWFPERTIMFHGAREDNDVLMLFITNKNFDIHFIEEEGKPNENN
ncbi:DUF4437 domain-containing protein [Acinetobacter baumannii]|uniref:cupin domain-containing protein n=1 Tax=Acinetobacter baumannii TaxID=470 RepID=UPI000BF3887E|nr:DUF4437 domain-containing protein [Acinetobacter baumannii]MDC4876266.1 DUF4437 domain-containing protein [Acinetobacter baumannii]MDC4887057.1 DUF4437 domain-containing protein [Acinetobacter baumannii]MDC4925903.1 DUF4437 domain-containing protein [Acinetobacter baumannii]MDC4940599.1 DUF4437 domain-containing protein [Acinetobacter baumannii]MDC4945176.1 DUF4437 domain-containing protein [Acinetobacter baumannii]